MMLRHSIVVALLAVAGVLGGCSTPATVQSLVAKARVVSVDTVATLSTSACESATAADYTATEVAVRKATAQVRAGSMAPADAQRVADAARVVRAELAATCAKSKSVPDAAAHARARAALKIVQQGVPR